VTPADGRLRILVLGTGAMGSLLAARLARSGAAEVTMAGTWAEGLEAIRARGVIVEDETGRWSAPVTAVSLAEAKAADCVLVLVKSGATATVAETAARSLAPGGTIVSLQNGLGHREVLERAAGAGRVVAGVATLGATLLGPGRVRAFPGEIVLGARDHGSVSRLTQALRAAGIEASVTTDIDRLLWRKLAVSCSINPITALRGLTNGAALASAAERERMAAAAREVAAVAAAKGIDLGLDSAAQALSVAARTAGNRSSMLQDLERGATTEIDAMCGAVVAEGGKLGVPTPVNEALWREVREREGRPVAAGTPAFVA
jgi:2-dehydropantoate 2-reductase